MPLSFTDRLLQVIEKRPDARFLTTVNPGREDQHSTYGQILDRAFEFAGALAARDVGPDDVVLLFLKQGLDSIAAFLGTVLLGAVPSFMPSQTDRQDPALFWEVNNQLFQHIKPKALIFEPGFLQSAGLLGKSPDLLEGEKGGRLLTARDLVPRQPDAPIDIVARLETDLLLLQHSSGTTGLKKGVMLSHRSVLLQLDGYAKEIALTNHDRIVSWLPLYHDMGLMTGFLLPLIHGVPVILLDPFEWAVIPRSLLEAIERHRATLAWMPNFAFNHLCRYRGNSRPDLSSLRAFINCSEPARWDSLRRFQESYADCGVSGRQFQVCYAMAETVFAATQTPLDKELSPLWVDGTALAEQEVKLASPENANASALLSCGRPLPGLQLAILDKQGDELPEDRVGEVSLRGDFLFSGYFRGADLHLDQSGWYRSRDLGFVHDGDLYVLGRLDDVIVSCGKNVYTHSLEADISTIEGVSPGRVAVFGVYDDQRGTENLVVVAETKLSEPGPRNQLRLSIIGRVNALYQMPPQAVQVVEPGWIVKTTSGKIARKANRDKYLAGLGQL